MSQLTPNILHYLALWRTPGIGPARFFKCIEEFPCLEELFKASDASLQTMNFPEHLLQGLKNPDWAGAERDLRWAEAKNHHLLTWEDENYPLLLKEISSRPPLLFVKGELSSIQSLQLAIVGSRNPTPTGNETAKQFSYALSQSGLTITSGLALGIDASAHSGALANDGKTIAVLGCGIDTIYPLRHKKLAEKITEKGALISEYPLGTAPQAENFPRRNRLVSGLSVGVLVVEATLKSGSLITARLAAEQGREVFVVPGSIHNPLARGCHYLIRQGAKLVETIDDILEELGPLTKAVIQPITQPQLKPTCKSPLTAMNGNYRQLLACMGFESTTIDQLINRTGFTAQQITAMTLDLEIKGLISAVPGGYIKAMC